MGHTAENTLHRILVWLLLLVMAIAVQADDGGVLNRKIQLPKSKESIYKLLRQVSDKSGYLFIYDSQIIDNDKEVKIAKGEYTLREAIYAITGNNRLKITVIGSHILLQLPEQKKVYNTPQAVKTVEPVENEYFTFTGMIYDRITDEPLAYSTVGVNNTTIGTISNQDGEFKLILPDSLRHSIIRLTRVGYENQEIEAQLLEGQHVIFTLEPKVIPLQEIIVRAVDPRQEITRMLARRKFNYPSVPTYITAFYREGIEHKKKNIDITEAILKVYKTRYQSPSNFDQVKLVKMRRIRNAQESDTIFTKMKSGINSCLTLDLMKELPDFLNLDDWDKYDYTHTDISVTDGRRVNIISFEQKDYITEPLYKGRLFIDAESQALVEARFEVNPKYISMATDMYIEKKNKDLKLTLEGAHYTVSYKLSGDSIYYINHVRGDIDFKVKRKRKLFSTPLHLWFEMVNCKVDTDDVNGFSRKERIPTRNIFSDIKYNYDKDFWGHFNVILPEDKLKELIINNLSEVSEIEDIK
ncbi:carboxypeptidase-like regulatory domain-containing protein [Dysgonomonas sp. 521]|uniref:carboxypeptidase-like regulatory domain-containing protein n=1 Tax=Dysgonomonas sp. 521 TaxID=2302932 RepID=UPI0013D6519F|nr:carboxypeptidase-like regulatory domain-containing protein [Dysgonomonas sp. 521]NDV97095.1 carboxypeptidase-like regulatory domain-containing protein [Dysgonomonas sp. 521]